MIKSKYSPYISGRPKGHWYKWKKDPKTVDAILMYAVRGHGKRSSYYSDFTLVYGMEINYHQLEKHILVLMIMN